MPIGEKISTMPELHSSETDRYRMGPLIMDKLWWVAIEILIPIEGHVSGHHFLGPLAQ